MQQTDADSGDAASGFQVLLLSSLVVAVGLASLLVLAPFLAALVWAAILAYITGPLYTRIRRPFGRYKSAAASAMTVLLTCAVILPILWMLMVAGDEMVAAYRAFATFLAQSPHELPAIVRRIPWLGELLQQQVDRFTSEPAALKSEITKWIQAWSGELAALLGGIGRNIGKVLTAMLTVFFFYRDGDTIMRQGRRVVKRFLGDRPQPYLMTAATMTRAVVYGVVVTAFAQGLIAGIGYAVLGIEGAALLGALTGVLSVVPVVGTAAVWGSLAAYLFVTGHLWKGVILLIWGTVLVHPVDNLLRPLLISNVSHVPFLLVMFGVVGGVATFGLVGGVLGPILLAVGLALWREWSAEDAPAHPAVEVYGERGSR